MKLSYKSSPLKGRINLPSSKSISNRILMIQALCQESFQIQNLSEAKDTQMLQHILRELNNGAESVVVDVQDAGTPYRFLLAYLAMQEGRTFILKGTERLNERPIESLVNALNQIGADITYEEKSGYAPLRIVGQKLNGGKVQIDGHLSSQFISALCLIAPYLRDGLEIHIKEEPVSASYIRMTLQLMKRFGIDYHMDSNHIVIKPQQYQPQDTTIESDWSSASFFYAMAMMSEEVDLTLNGLEMGTLQGDAMIAMLATEFGIESIFNQDGIQLKRSFNMPIHLDTLYNLKDQPDMAIPFILASAIKFQSVKICGIDHLEYKESKRIAALTNELQKIGIQLNYENAILSFQQDSFVSTSEVQFNSFDDHRLAMAFSMLAIPFGMAEVIDTECVSKSFPNYFEEIKKIGFVEM